MKWAYVFLAVLAVLAAPAVAAHPHNGTDDDRPWIGFKEPFNNSVNTQLPTHHTVERGDVAIGGVVHDNSSIKHVRILHRYQYTTSSGRYGDTAATNQTRAHNIPDSDGSFQQRLQLGKGENTVRVQVEDVHGNSRQYEFILDNEDTTDPDPFAEVDDALDDLNF